MKKIIVSIVMSFFSLGAYATQVAEPVSGRVICSTQEPSFSGFEAVKVLAKDRPYVGVHIMGNLSITTEYRSKYASFSMTVAPLDEDAIEQDPILATKTTLIAGDFWRSRTVHEGFVLEISCNFVPNSSR